MKKIIILPLLLMLWFWFTSDAITKTSILTKARLHTNFFLDDQIVVDWLESYHGEASNYQVMLIFVDWGEENRDDFKRIVEKSSDKVKSRVMRVKE